ncbi:DUF4214 domain-containing protein [Halomonas sp. HMF6819]|uniref:DUF4214 domain-containing protein n=1 Tax=Halomonas sp. HMF6819 TaxID=3373085 RepID=UPI00379A98D6
MESSVALNLAQSFYVAYYGRPADPSGLLFWASQISSSGGLIAIRNDFGNSPEFNERFGSLSTAEMVNNLYQQMFSRDAEVEGLTFWTTALNEGRATLASAALEILNGAQGGDAMAFQNKLEAANYFTASLDTEVQVQSYQELEAADTAADVLNSVDQREESLERFKDIVEQANGVPGSGESPDSTLEEVADDIPPPADNPSMPQDPPQMSDPTLGETVSGVGEVLDSIVSGAGNTFGDNLGSVTDETGDVLGSLLDESGDVVDDVGGVIGGILDGLLGTPPSDNDPVTDNDADGGGGLLDGLLGGLLGGEEAEPVDDAAHISLSLELIQTTGISTHSDSVEVA